ncbi:MAG: glycosyltransferase family 2 protein [Nitrospiraceae bacterium]
MKLSIIIPAYNEAQTIRAVIERVAAVDLGTIEKEIVVVDDGSQDETPDILKTIPGIHPIIHARNAGKGAAVTTGIKAANGDVVIIQDADLEYDPSDYPVVITPILKGSCDAVMGSRFLYERPVFFGKRRSPYFVHYIGNLLIVTVTNWLYGQRFTDYEGCYKAFSKRTLAAVPVSATGFEFDNELICKLIRKGFRIVEVPIQYKPRTYAHGKKITWRHGVKILWTIAKWRFLPL